MPLFVLPYPIIDPVIMTIGPFSLRWYALAYIAGFLLGLLLLKILIQRPNLWGPTRPPSAFQLDDLLLFVSLGVILGGRIGHILFYDLAFYIENPAEIFKIWNGGMSFHGGLLGAFLSILFCARRIGFSPLVLTDCVVLVAPIGLFLGRLANFIKPELWGRVSDVPWAMIFPNAGPFPRHPSQLYEAGLEGIVLFSLLIWLVSRFAFHRPGRLTGVFAIGYGCARIFCEFFREPELFLPMIPPQITIGMLLSFPLILAGIYLLWRSQRAPSPSLLSAVSSS